MTRAARVGCIFKLQADGSLVKILQNFITPNGMAFSPDGRTMYLSDSHPAVRSVWAYDYDTENGVASNARPFMDMGGFKGRPDGAAMDVDGCYWICGNDAGLVHRYTPRGELDFSVEVPASKPSMCAFGGKDLRTLYITTIRPSGSSADDLSGGVFAIDLPDIQGMPEARCSIAPASRFSQHTHPA
jgi:sugar lactone lactonase YvrE